MAEQGSGDALYRMVHDFHIKFGQSAPARATGFTPQLAEVRANIVREEMRELNQAFAADDLIEVLDALADLAYGVYGTAVAAGTPVNVVYPVPVATGPRLERAAAKLPGLELAVEHFDKEVSSTPESEKVWAVSKEVLGRIAEIATRLPVDFPAIFGEVHRTNMNKLAPPGGDGKAIKPADWTGPDFAPILAAQLVGGAEARQL